MKKLLFVLVTAFAFLAAGCSSVDVNNTNINNNDNQRLDEWKKASAEVTQCKNECIAEWTDGDITIPYRYEEKEQCLEDCGEVPRY